MVVQHTIRKRAILITCHISHMHRQLRPIVVISRGKALLLAEVLADATSVGAFIIVGDGVVVGIRHCQIICDRHNINPVKIRGVFPLSLQLILAGSRRLLIVSVELAEFVFSGEEILRARDVLGDGAGAGAFFEGAGEW